MSLSREDIYWHDIYEQLSFGDQTAVDNSLKLVQKELEKVIAKPSNDDPAESLVAAITRYLVESRQ